MVHFYEFCLGLPPVLPCAEPVCWILQAYPTPDVPLRVLQT